MQSFAILAFFALLAAVANVEFGERDRVFAPNIQRPYSIPAQSTTAPTTTTTPSPAGLLAPHLNSSKYFVPSTKTDQDFLIETCFNSRFYKIAADDFYNCSRIYKAASSNDTQEPMYLEMRQKFALMVAQFDKQQEKDNKRVKSCFKAHRTGNFTKKLCRQFLVFPKFEIPRTPREALRKENFDNMLRWLCAYEQNMTKPEEALCRDFNLKRVHECVFTQASKTDFCKLVLNGPVEHLDPMLNLSNQYLGKLYDLSKELLRDPWMQ